jgi:hypothetical protein
MAIDTELAELMQDQVVFRAGTAIDNYGKRTYSTAGTVTGRLIYDNMMERTDDMREFKQTGRFLTYGSATVDLKYRMTLPDASEAIIIGASSLTDETGNEHHMVIRFGQ